MTMEEKGLDRLQGFRLKGQVGGVVLGHNRELSRRTMFSIQRMGQM